MTRMNLMLTGIAMVFAAGCLVLFGQLSTERKRAHALEAQVERMRSELVRPRPAATTETAPAIEPPAQPVETQPVATQPAAASPTTAAAKPVSTEDSAERERQRRILADPLYRAAVIAENRRAMQSEYPGLATELGLSKEEADRFFNLLAEQSFQESESASKKQPGEDPQQRRRALFERQEQERRQLLGEQRFQAWTEYVNSASARTLVGQLRTQLATSSSPLREEQIKPLVKALAAEHQRHWAERQQNYASFESDESTTAERVAYMERRARLVEQSVARSREAGAMYLDSTQQRTLDALLEQASERAREEIVTWRAFWEAEERQR
ncbi:MAG TPA: hypothetical protein VFO35_03825 [Steroidobacteraceae bacterium]|nr:hypothetical protein [Steroidobacteraceae bacterium]